MGVLISTHSKNASTGGQVGITVCNKCITKKMAIWAAIAPTTILKLSPIPLTTGIIKASTKKVSRPKREANSINMKFKDCPETSIPPILRRMNSTGTLYANRKEVIFRAVDFVIIYLPVIWLKHTK